jgi:hypothetical protein
MSYRDFFNCFALPSTDSVEIKNKIDFKIDQDDIMWDKLLNWIYLIKVVGLKNASPAQILEKY